MINDYTIEEIISRLQSTKVTSAKSEGSEEEDRFSGSLSETTVSRHSMRTSDEIEEYVFKWFS